MKDRYAKLAAEGEDSVHGESFDPVQYCKSIGYCERDLRILFEKAYDSTVLDNPLRGKIISLHVSAKK